MLCFVHVVVSVAVLYAVVMLLPDIITRVLRWSCGSTVFMLWSLWRWYYACWCVVFGKCLVWHGGGREYVILFFSVAQHPIFTDISRTRLIWTGFLVNLFKPFIGRIISVVTLLRPSALWKINTLMRANFHLYGLGNTGSVNVDYSALPCIALLWSTAQYDH